VGADDHAINGTSRCRCVAPCRIWVGTHVFGLSLGDMVAHELAIQHPDKIRTLVLAATTAGGSNPDFRVGSLVVGC